MYVTRGRIRLKTLGSWFKEWLESAEDWTKTSLMMEASRTTLENNRGREAMLPYKSLKDKFGRKTADNIRLRKHEQEKQRNPLTDPKPFHLEHPETDDKEPRTKSKSETFFL